MTAADLLALVLFAAARDALETQAGAKRIRAASGDMFALRTRLNVWARRVHEHCISEGAQT